MQVKIRQIRRPETDKVLMIIIIQNENKIIFLLKINNPFVILLLLLLLFFQSNYTLDYILYSDNAILRHRDKDRETKITKETTHKTFLI